MEWSSHKQELMVANGKALAPMDSGAMDNRSKLLRLAETVKPTRRKVPLLPRAKTTLHKEDPSYTNIEHLVFGTYRGGYSPGGGHSTHPSRSSSSSAANSGVVASRPGCYHSLDRSRLLTSGNKALPVDAHANITLLRVEYLPPSAASSDEQQEASSSSQRRSSLCRTQQKTPVHVLVNRQAKDGGPAAAATRTSPAKTVIRIRADPKIEESVLLLDPTTDDNASSCSSLNTSMLTSSSTTTTPTTSDTTASSSIYLSADSLDGSASSSASLDEFATPRVPTPPPPSPPAAARRRHSASTTTTPRPRPPSKVPQPQPAVNGGRAPPHVRRSTSSAAAALQTTTKTAPKATPTAKRFPQQQSKCASKDVMLLRAGSGTRTAGLRSSSDVLLSHSNSSLDSTEGPSSFSSSRSSASSSRRSGKNGATTTATRIPSRCSSSAAASSSSSSGCSNSSSSSSRPPTLQQKTTSKTAATAASATKRQPQQQSSNSSSRRPSSTAAVAEREETRAEPSSEDPHLVTCVKTLPREGENRPPSRGSPERYSLERPSRALYTWYETRRRPSLVMAQQSPWQPPSGNSSDRPPPPPPSSSAAAAAAAAADESGGRRTASLPKSFHSDVAQQQHINGSHPRSKQGSSTGGGGGAAAKNRRSSLTTSRSMADGSNSSSCGPVYLEASSTKPPPHHDGGKKNVLQHQELEPLPPPAAPYHDGTRPPLPDQQAPTSSASEAEADDSSPAAIGPSAAGPNTLLPEPSAGHRAPAPSAAAAAPACTKALRRLKASSSPAAFAVVRGGGADLSASEGDLRRPWSQLYTEEEVQRALASSAGCDLDLPGSGGCSPVDPPSPSSPAQSPVTCKGMMLPVFTARCSSLRAPNHQSLHNGPGTATTPTAAAAAASAETVLQKFRKSFSLRFNRIKRPSSPSLSDRAPTPSATAASSEAEEICGGGCGASPPSYPVTGGAEDETDNTVFRFGPLVWRSSKEKRQKNNARRGGGVQCSSPDSGIQVEISSPRRVQAFCPPTPPPSNSTPSSPGIVPRRAQSSSLRLDRTRRPLSDVGSGFSSSVVFSDSKFGLAEDKNTVRRTYSDLGGTEPIRNAFSKSQIVKAVPPLVKMRSEKRISVQRLRRHYPKLRRSISQPMEIEKMTSSSSLSYIQGLSDTEDTIHDSSTASSDEDTSSEGENSSSCNSHRWSTRLQSMEYVTFAEALWDHVTMDPLELPLKVGDLVAVLDCTDRHWWVGALGDRTGWFPAAFVRPKVNQADTENNFPSKMSDDDRKMNGNNGICKASSSPLSNDQIRTNVVQEIVATEKDFVQHLKDVVEGYLKQMRRRIDMFPEERINIIFANIEQISNFQTQFLASLENCIDWNEPHRSQVGSCFVNHKEGFQIYSDYCNNHPYAANELQELFTIPKYSHFFEACRLLQDMIDISLDGFLLTPIQKICKYPLQLAELLKYTPMDHPDRPHVVEALESMREVALYINERKRRMECLEKLAAWQIGVEYWEGPDLLDHSSQLIHSGDVTKMSSSWSRDITLFLFDHQLIMCKKDLLKRHTFCYRSRVNMNDCEVVNLPDGRDTQSGLSVKYAWRLHCHKRDKYYTFCSKTTEEKNQWMKAFQEERERVQRDKEQGLVMSERAKRAATALANNRLKRSKSKNGKEFRAWRMPPANLVHHPTLKSKTTSLPYGSLLSKKKHTGWFIFGSNKKHKR